MDRSKSQGQQDRKDQQSDVPNQNANKEPAEGSRENVVTGQQGQNQAGPAQYRGDQGHQGGGVTNRPLEREQSEQSQLPQRGHSKDEDRNG